MGLLEQQQGLLPATSNPKMLAQALKARQQPRTQLTGQGLLDTAAIGLSPVPVVGDALGLAADASRFYNEPESRTPLNFGLAALGLIPFVPPLVSAGLGKFAQSQGKTLAQTPTGPARNQAGAIVYHGSPHKFDAFDSSKIGTGEGAQAYGHGLYLAENPATARAYQKSTAIKGEVKVPNSVLDGFDVPVKDVQSTAVELLQREAFNPGYLKTIADNESYLGKIATGIMDGKITAPQGSLYKVDLPDEAIAKMLDYDAPLSKQPEEVKKALLKLEDTFPGISRSVNNPDGGMTGEQLFNAFTRPRGGYRNAQSSVELSDALKNTGIPGIRYLDGGSRGVGNGTSNFVVFPGNEGLLKILERQ